MNVNDVKPIILPDDPVTQAGYILDRQTLLEDHYWTIEKRPSPTVAVNSQVGQILIKDFLWRITEEVGESLEASLIGEPLEKIYEELADGLHFVAGLAVITNMKDPFIKAWNETVMGPQPRGGITSQHTYLYDLIASLGILGNTLKMKPWKQTQVLTDEVYFSQCLQNMITCFLRFCIVCNLTHHQLLDYYHRKSEVNLFRIRSKY